MIRVQMDQAYACCGKEQPNKIANLLKHAVHGATKLLDNICYNHYSLVQSLSCQCYQLVCDIAMCTLQTAYKS